MKSPCPYTCRTQFAAGTTIFKCEQRTDRTLHIEITTDARRFDFQPALNLLLRHIRAGRIFGVIKLKH